jgi:hypothetical protein
MGSCPSFLYTRFFSLFFFYFLSIHHLAENDYELSSMGRRVICFFVHLQEGYENFHPSINMRVVGLLSNL